MLIDAVDNGRVIAVETATDLRAGHRRFHSEEVVEFVPGLGDGARHAPADKR